MLRSQIKRAPDGFIQLRRFKDFEKSPGRRTILRHFAHAVTNQRAPDGSFFGNAVSALFKAPHGTRTDIDRLPDGHRAATGRRPDGHRSNLELPSGHRAVAVRFMLSSQFNHSNRTDVNGLSDGPINRPVAVQL